MWSLSEGRPQPYGVQKYGSEEDNCERKAVIRDWRKLHNKELHKLYSSLNIVWVIKSRRMRWMGQVVQKNGRGEVHIKFW
jgi:hypothetical protein